MREICTSGLTRGKEVGGHWPCASHPVASLPTLPLFAGKIRIRVCAGEAGSHVGESPTGRIRRFTTERDVREEAARLNLQAGHLLNQQAITKVNSI